jgi:hypothetical protein
MQLRKDNILQMRVNLIIQASSFQVLLSWPDSQF